MAITIISYCMIKPINNSINRSVFGHYIPAVIAFPVYWFGYQIILKLMNVNDSEVHTYQQLALAMEGIKPSMHKIIQMEICDTHQQ